MINHTIQRLKAVWHPERFHGWGKKRSFFEGWYFKLVCESHPLAIAIIPGVSIDVNGRRSAFIQVLDGMGNQSAYHHFPFEAFQANPNSFEVSLGDNFFSSERMEVHLPGLDMALKFGETVPWPRVHGIPGVMGIFTFVPFMQCYHGVVSMHHEVNGHVRLAEQSINLENACGYIEKDWGSSFPKSWIWMQTNNFNAGRSISFMFSLAHIPWMGTWFNGFLCGLWIDGKLYRFATYTGAKVSGQVHGNKADIEIRQGDMLLKIHAERDDGGDLISPIKGEMIGKVNESMRSHVDLAFFIKEENILQGKGIFAGMEFSGEIDRLFT
jgi:tocopherol cyclase